MNRTTMTRREILAGVAALATTAILPRWSFAQERGAQFPPYARYRIGGANVTVLYGGYAERPVKGFFTNQENSVVADRLRQMGLDSGTLQLHDSVLVIDYGGQLAIVGPGPAKFIEPAPEANPAAEPLKPDNGGEQAQEGGAWDDSNGWDDDKKDAQALGRAGAGTTMTDGIPTWLINFQLAGFTPDKVEALMFSNMRGAEIDLLKPIENDAYLFPKARPLVPEAEWNYWMTPKPGEKPGEATNLDPETQRIREIFQPIEKDVLRFPPGVELTPGLGGILAPGFTPGHNAFALTSEGKTLLIPSEALPLPFMIRDGDWTCATEMDGKAAVETRRMLLEGAYAQKNFLLIKSAPLPNVGNLIMRSDGPDFEPLNPETAIARPGESDRNAVGAPDDGQGSEAPPTVGAVPGEQSQETGSTAGANTQN